MDLRSAIGREPPRWACVGVGAGFVALAALGELVMGRRLWGIGGQPGLWSGDIWSAHNSQYMFDPYSFSHITHGILLYGLAWLIAPGLARGARAAMAVGMESAWEVVENTDMVIRRYRAATISLNYYGDSVMNSMCDIAASLVGIALAAVLPPRATVAVALALEVTLALWIHDSLVLNIVMLIRPMHAIAAWQMRH